MASQFNLPPELDIAADEDFTKERLDRAWNYIIQRLLILDSFKPGWETQIELLKQTGLSRLNEAIQPVYVALTEIANMGVIFSASATGAVEFGMGNKSFVVGESDRERFAPAAYLAAASSDNPSLMMVGRLSSYNRDTGVLVLNIEEVGTESAGTFTSWRISPSTNLDLHKAYVDAQVIAAKGELKGSVTTAFDTLAEIEGALNGIFDGVPEAQNSLRKLNDRITGVIGGATAAGNTLKKLEDTISDNAAMLKKYAKKQAIVFG